MHIRRIGFATVGILVSLLLILGVTISSMTVTHASWSPVTFAPPVAHAGSVLGVVVGVALVVTGVGALAELGAIDSGLGAFGVSETATGFSSTLGFESSTALGAFATEQAVTSLAECAVGLICGNDGGNDGGTYSVAPKPLVPGSDEWWNDAWYNGGKNSTNINAPSSNVIYDDNPSPSPQVCYGPVNSCGRSYEGTYEWDSATGQMGCKVSGSFSYGAPPESECPGPAVSYFRAGSDTIDAGGETTLEWSSPSAASCKLSGGSSGDATVAAEGTTSTGPLAVTTSYQIACADGSGHYGSPLSLTVRVLEPDVSISADRLRVKKGDTAVITWSGKDVQSCTVTDLSGTTLASGTAQGYQFSAASPYSATITTQSVFKIACETLGDPIAKSVTVNVVPNYGEF